LDRLSDESTGVGFKKEQWFLSLIGILPEHQRKGLAKAMIKSVENAVSPFGMQC
jgi:GNAT superfamily N-acetyltransferase